MKFLILGLLMSSFAMASGREGGGGNVQIMREMRMAPSLSAEQIKLLIENNGLLVKKEVLTQIPIYFSTENDVENPKAKEIYNQMRFGKVSLTDDFIYSAYQSGCKCPEGKDMCTDNKNYATVCFNVDSLVSAKTSYAEFIGMLVHEHSHHFVGELDHTYNYALANYFQEKAANDQLVGKMFKGALEVIVGSRIKTGFISWDRDPKINKAEASKFCELKNYGSLKSFEKKQNLRDLVATFTIASTTGNGEVEWNGHRNYYISNIACY